MVQEKLPEESLIDLDNNVVTAVAVSGDEEIIAKIQILKKTTRSTKILMMVM